MILLVFDNPKTYALSRKLSEKIGCRVTIVSNLLEALDVLDKESIEMLLIDLCHGQTASTDIQVINHIQKDTLVMFHYQLSIMSTDEIAHLVLSLYALMTVRRLASDSFMPAGYPAAVQYRNDSTWRG